MIPQLESLLKIAASSKNSEMFAAIFDQFVTFFQLSEEEQERFHKHLWNLFLKQGKLSKKLASDWVLKRKLVVNSKKNRKKKVVKASRTKPALNSIKKLLGDNHD